MTTSRLPGYVDQLRQAAGDAAGFVEGLSKAEFFEDKRTQRAVLMSLLIVGEAATQIMERYPDFIESANHVPWKSMRGMRNRIAHGYFDLNLDVVWDTVQSAVPALLAGLSTLQEDWRDEGDPVP